MAEVTPNPHCNMALRSAVFEVMRRHEVSEQCFAEVAMVTHAALPLQQGDSYLDYSDGFVHGYEKARAESAAKDAEIARLREALIRCGRAAGAGLADTVSTDFLMLVPAEVEAKIATLAQGSQT